MNYYLERFKTDVDVEMLCTVVVDVISVQLDTLAPTGRFVHVGVSDRRRDEMMSRRFQRIGSHRRWMLISNNSSRESCLVVLLLLLLLVVDCGG